MKTIHFIVCVLTSVLITSVSTGQTPRAIEYSGRVVIGGTNFWSSAAAPGFFKTVLLTKNGSEATIWSNDGDAGNPAGSSSNGGEPTGAVELINGSESTPYVASGQFRLRLGDGAATPEIGPEVLTDSSGNVRGNVYLRVWFSADNTVFERLDPDVKVGAAAYAIWAAIAETVKDRAITEDKLAGGSVSQDKLQVNAIGTAQLRAGSVTPDKIAPTSITAAQIAPGTITSNELSSQSIAVANLDLSAIIDAIIPAGTIQAFGGSRTNIPDGWLWCDGSEVSRITYGRLFGVIQTAWGSGDGTNTFRIPDLRGTFLRGVNAGRNGPYSDAYKNSRQALAVGSNAGDLVGSFQTSKNGAHTHGNSSRTAINGTLTARIYVSSANNVHADHVGLPSWSANKHSSNGTTLTPESTVEWGAAVVGRTAGDNPNNNESRPHNAYVNYIIKY